MTTSINYHTQGIRGYHNKKTQFKGQSVYYHLVATASRCACPYCKSMSSGFKKTLFVVQVRRISCKRCGACARERIDFCPKPNVSYTKWLVKFILALRADMSITAVARLTGLHWQSIKDIEKTYLSRKYQKVRLGAVRWLGIDEGIPAQYLQTRRLCINGPSGL